jgi:DNA-binding Xre family transcriptional regulator
MLVATDLMLRSRWVLRAFMAQHKIKNVELAEAIGRHVTTIARMKAEDSIPTVGGEALDEICHGLTKVLRGRGEEAVVRLTDLIEFYDSGD